MNQIHWRHCCPPRLRLQMIKLHVTKKNLIILLVIKELVVPQLQDSCHPLTANRRINLPTKSDLSQYLVEDHAVTIVGIDVCR